MKKKALKVIAVFCVVISVFFAGCNGEKTNDNDNTTATNQQNANAPAYGTKENKAVDELSADLLVDSSVKKVKYLKGIYTGDPYLPEHNTDEVKAERKKNAQRYAELIGLKEEPEFTVDLLQRVSFTSNDRYIEAGENFVAVTPPSIPFGIDATDTEIIDFLKSDKYLTVLADLSGIDLDNAFIYREDDGTIEELEQSTSDGAYIVRDFTICNKADSPADQAFELASNTIEFCIIVGKQPNDFGVHFYANWVKEENIAEATIKLSTLSDAKKQADDEITSKLDVGEKITDKNNVKCRICYDREIKDTYSIPCYQFYYETNYNRYVTASVPCIDISALS